MRVSMLPISVGNLFLQKQKVENKTTTVPNLGLKSDIFIKSSSPNFGNSMTPNEKDLFMSDIKRSIDFNSEQEVLSKYEQAPELVETILASISKLENYEARRYDDFWGVENAGQKLGLYSRGESKYSAYSISYLNKSLLRKSNCKAIKALTEAIAKRNPDYFNKSNIIAMYANEDCVSTLSIIAQKDSEKVFSTLEQELISCDKGKITEQMAIENIPITPERQSVFQTLFEIDPYRTSTIISSFSQKRREQFDFDESMGDPKVNEVLKTINSKDDCIDVNKRLLELYDESPETMIKALLSPCKRTGDLYVNTMMRDKKNSYYGIMLYMLVKNPDKFFDIAQKSNFMWYAAKNKNQSYLQLMEQALYIDAPKTKDLLVKPISNQFIYPRTTPIMECVDNKTFDYTELFKAFYQEDEKTAFELFVSKAEDTSLLNYYVNQKGYMSEDFVSYLTNQNLRFVKCLLPPDTLTQVKDLRYKTAMENLGKVRTELEDEFGRKLSETEERVMHRISLLEEELHSEVSRLDSRIDGVQDTVNRLSHQVYTHINPIPNPKKENIDPRCNSERRADAAADAALRVEVWYNGVVRRSDNFFNSFSSSMDYYDWY